MSPGPFPVGSEAQGSEDLMLEHYLSFIVFEFDEVTGQSIEGDTLASIEVKSVTELAEKAKDIFELIKIYGEHVQVHVFAAPN
jgi:hypothetical protein